MASGIPGKAADLCSDERTKHNDSMAGEYDFYFIGNYLLWSKTLRGERTAMLALKK